MVEAHTFADILHLDSVVSDLSQPCTQLFHFLHVGTSMSCRDQALARKLSARTDSRSLSFFFTCGESAKRSSGVIFFARAVVRLIGTSCSSIVQTFL